MDNKQNIFSSREAYKNAFIDLKRESDIKVLEFSFDDPTCVFKAARGNRVMQVNVEDDALPSVFINSIEKGFSKSYLKMVVRSNDLKISDFRQVLLLWLIEGRPEEQVDKFLEALDARM